jgi:hypothetical protein
MSLIYHRDRRMTHRLRSVISFAISEFGTVMANEGISFK